MSMTGLFDSESILYYPTIEFEDVGWLKSALTIWDKVYRIVPLGYHPMDSWETNVAKNAGFIEDIVLTAADLNLTAIDYEIFCEGARVIPQGLDLETYSVRLHSDKIDQRLKPFFAQYSKVLDSDGFYRLPEEVANGYMFFLSDTVSKRRNLPKITDNVDMFTAMTYYDYEGDFEEWLTNDEATDIYSNLIMETLSPSGFETFSMEKLVSLNKVMSEYKKEYRRLVSEFTQNASKIQDSTFLLQAIKQFRDDLVYINGHKNEVLKTFFTDLKPSFLYTGLPVLAASLIGSLYAQKEDIFASSLLQDLGKGMFLGAVASLGNSARDIRKRWNSKRSNYYLELSDQSLRSSGRPITNIAGRLHEFMND